MAGLYIGPPPLLVTPDIDDKLELDLLSEQPYSSCVSSLVGNPYCYQHTYLLFVINQVVQGLEWCDHFL